MFAATLPGVSSELVEVGPEQIVASPLDRAFVVLEHSQWPMVKLVAENIVAAVNAPTMGSYVEVDVPFKE